MLSATSRLSPGWYYHGLLISLPHLIQVKLLIPPGELIGTSAWRGFFFPHLVLVSRKMWWYMAARHV